MDTPRKISIDCLINFNIPVQTTQYLTQEGLEDELLLNMIFYQSCDKFKLLVYNNQRFITIGGNEFMDWIFINEASEQVCSIDVEMNSDIGYINKNVVCLGKSLTAFKEYIASYHRLPFEERESGDISLRADFINKLTSIDPESLNYSENFWALLIEQMIDGLF